jgi:glycosyltransferase involved in cell wall biosynthesis
VDSALALPFPSKEVIVVDDGSTDGSAELLKRYAGSIHPLPLLKNAGAIAARNHGAAAATGNYLVFLDGDDLLIPWTLDVYDRIITASGAKIICGQTLWFSGEAPKASELQAPRHIKFVSYPNFLSKDRPVGFSASSFVVERGEFERVGGWTPGIFQMDLQDIALKLGCSGPLALIIEPCTVFYRTHSANSINNVPPFLKMVRLLVARDKEGKYPGGQQFAFKRRAWCGGFIFFWVKRAWRAGLRKDALTLGAGGWFKIATAMAQRVAQRLVGRKPVQTLEMS